MWSSLTLSRQARSKARKDATEKDATEKVTEAEKKKLARAATFCYDSQHRNQKTKKHWLIGNIPNIKKKVRNRKRKFMFLHMWMRKKLVIIMWRPREIMKKGKMGKQ